MKKIASCIWIAAAVSACAAPNASDEPFAEDGPEVAAAVSALKGECTGDLARFVRNQAFFAASAATDAASTYSPDDANALLYFGDGHDGDAVLSTMQKIGDIGPSDQVVFSCDPSGVADGTLCANTDVALWTESNAWTTGDWTIHVCGDVIMTINGEDKGLDASPTGVMVHEIAHLAGAWLESSGGEDGVIRAAASPQTTPLIAEAYRFYVMN